MVQVTNKDVNYTELSQELAELIARLEQGELSVDDAVASYERGLQIVATLEAHLQKADNKIHQLATTYGAAGSADEEE